MIRFLFNRMKKLKTLDKHKAYKEFEQKRGITIKLKQLTSYQQYLDGKWWIKRRAKYWRTHSRICFCCNNYADNLHHRTYSRLYNEQDDDFVPLYKKCHTEIHNLVLNDQQIKLKNAHQIYKQLLIQNYNELDKEINSHLLSI